MDFGLTAEQERYRRAVSAFAESLNDADGRRRERDGVFAVEAWRRCAEFGILGLPLPAAYGGSDADPITIAVAMEAMGLGCRDAGLLFSLHAQLWAVEIPILLFGSETQKARYLPGLAAGRLIGAHAMTEPGSGSDAFSLTTRAGRSERGYVLSGTKTFSTNAPVADVILLFATADAARGLEGISAFLLDRDTKGLTVSAPTGKLGLRTSPMGEVHLDACEVSEEQRLGPDGAGGAIFTRAMEWERTFILASQVGAMRRQLEASIRYAKERRQFGQPIGKFQLVAERIARMKVRLDGARLLLYRAAWTRAQGRSAMLDAAIAKLFISEAAVQSALDALQIHGGYGYTTEFDVERELRDALAGPLYSGTSEIQTLLIARLLGLRGGHQAGGSAVATTAPAGAAAASGLSLGRWYSHAVHRREMPGRSTMSQTLSQLLDASAAYRPDATAVIGDGQRLTYGELARLSHRITRLLMAEGVKAGDRVGVCLPKSPTSVATLYGILGAGAAYVPLDPTAPPSRWAVIVRDCGIGHLVMSPHAHARLAGLPRGDCPPLTMLLTEGVSGDTGGIHRVVGWDAVVSQPARAAGAGARPDDLAYVLYTSGSSGSPKGVAITHRASLAFVQWAIEALGVRGDDRFSSHAPFHFDLSVLDLYATAGVGGAVVLVPERVLPFPVRLAELIEAEAISVWYSVPSALVRLLTHGGLERFTYRRLRLILFAGEVFPPKHLRALAARVPQATLINLYGPTETNVCTFHEVARPLPADDEPIPIGRACAGTEVFALDQCGDTPSPGALGELYVKGPTLMSGYWGRSGATSEALGPDPRPGQQGLVYRTGDLVRQRPDGCFLFAGRRDHMVKSRGYRIELEEIDSVLCACPGVAEGVTLAIADDTVGHRIVAAVVPDPESMLMAGAVLRFCADRLPPYMVPERITLRASLPKTSTGKVDRHAALAAIGMQSGEQGAPA